MLAAEENFWGRQRKEGRIKVEELSIVKDVPKHARDSGLRLKGRRAIWTVGCLRNFIPIGLQPAWVEFATGRAQWSCVLNWQVWGDEIAGRNEKRTGDPAVCTQEHTSARPRHGNYQVG